MYFTADVSATTNRLKNVPVGSPWNVHEWDVQG